MHLITQLINQSGVSNCYITPSFFLGLVTLPINLAQKGNLLSISSCLLLHYLYFLSIIHDFALGILHCLINSYRLKTQSCNFNTISFNLASISCNRTTISCNLTPISCNRTTISCCPALFYHVLTPLQHH